MPLGGEQATSQPSLLGTEGRAHRSFAPFLSLQTLLAPRNTMSHEDAPTHLHHGLGKPSQRNRAAQGHPHLPTPLVSPLSISVDSQRPKSIRMLRSLPFPGAAAFH